MADPKSINLGFVVIGRNEGDRLKRCLGSIPASRRPTIYVDSGSNDASVQVASELGAMTLALDPARPFTAARGREEGWRALVGARPDIDYIQFIDGDCELVDGWISVAAEALDRSPTIAVVCGRRRERHPERSFYNAVCDQEWDTPVGLAAACGGDAMMRASALQEVGGFDPSMLAGEEPELCSRLGAAGWDVWRIDAEMTVHDAAMTQFAQWWKRARRSGAGYAQAWGKTAHLSQRLYQRELARAVWWAGLVPGSTLAFALAVHPAALAFAPAAWAAQIVRLTPRLGWRKAVLVTVSKPAELAGALDWWCQAVTSRKHHALSYK